METLWRWFFRFVIGVGIVFVAFTVLLVIGMNRPNVMQSNGYTGITPDAVAATLSHSLPKTAHNIRYCRASVGIGGRLLIYRFSGSLPDLHAHAHAEFAAHWEKPRLKKTRNSPSPITEHTIALYKSGFGVDADWMLPPPEAFGTLYESADGRSSHRPRIFVDEANGVLYFHMTD
ncbi:MAG: hypothetical protein GXP27_00680 [Planctomycetes bacterium]|nr:hypothetical protein [Planctomycetota bacterium]